MITPEDRQRLHETLSGQPYEFVYPWTLPSYGEAMEAAYGEAEPTLSDMMQADECNLRKGGA